MNYTCPKCHSQFKFHNPDCPWGGIDWHHIEKAYTDILAVLTRAPQTLPALRENTHGDWTEIHGTIFDSRFVDDSRVEKIGEVEQDGTERSVYKLRTPDEIRADKEIPSHKDLTIIYEQGGCDGCLDDSVVSMIAYWEMVDFDWEKTRELALDWLDESGTWTRGSFEESSPEELIDSKKHVYSNGYGWKNAASQASSVIKSNQ